MPENNIYVSVPRKILAYFVSADVFISAKFCSFLSSFPCRRKEIAKRLKLNSLKCCFKALGQIRNNINDQNSKPDEVRLKQVFFWSGCFKMNFLGA